MERRGGKGGRGKEAVISGGEKNSGRKGRGERWK